MIGPMREPGKVVCPAQELAWCANDRPDWQSSY
jgi:hypothetical protein